MGVKPCYEHKEVVVIPPEAWEVTTLGDLGSTYGGLTGKTKADFGDGSDHYITFMNVVSNVVIDCETFERVRISSGESQNRVVMGDLLFNGSSETPEEVALCAVLAADVSDLYLNSFCFGFRFRAGAEADGLFLAYYLRSSEGRELMKSLAQGSTRYNLSKVALLKSPLCLPRISEQAEIAEALSDVDALLAALDRLLTKKRDLKQAAMQQLLTGQTRLPGFHDEWEVKALGDLGSTYGGLTGKTKADFGDGSDHYISFMNVVSNVVIDCRTFERVRISPSESQNRVVKGDLLFNGSSETPEEVALCAVLAADVSDLYLNSFCFGFRFRAGAEADGLFLAYYLRSSEGRELMKSLAQGSTRYNLSKVALLKSPLRLPCISEQTEISAVIADMDTELALLEQRMAKTRDLKHGMMQELLTGRTRLV